MTTRTNGKAGNRLFDPTEVRRALDVCFPFGQVTELRALEAVTPTDRWPHTESGYFDDCSKLIESLTNLNSAKGVYFILNEVDPALLARAANRIKKAGKGGNTSDNNILRRRWLLVDCDAHRPADISATDAEHEAAIERCREIYRCLQSAGWPEPVAADSGNGAHLLYRIDLPADDAGIVQRCLLALAAKFDDDVVKIDKGVFNPARIVKLYGTLACKGDSTADRPHRMSRILRAPEDIQAVERVLLESLAAEAPAEPTSNRAHSTNGQPFDIDAFIHRHGLDVAGPDAYQGGRRWTFNQSPMCDHHDDGPYLIQFASGALSAGCHHDSCAWDWNALRAAIEPKQSTPRQSGSTRTPAKVSSVNGAAIDTAEKDLSIITPLAWAALNQANNPPLLFRFGGVASRIEFDDKGAPCVRPLTFDRMRYHLARAVKWIETRKVGDESREQATSPPKAVVEDVLATPNHPLPMLSRIVEAPVFSAGGVIQTAKGYHPESQTYYSPAPGFHVDDVPQHPEGVDLESARTLICDELLSDFPFAGDAELAHAVAVLLLPFARDLIAGPTPLHLIEKPSPGTGATLLVDMLTLPATGRPLAVLTEGRDEDEWRKRITAKLRSGSLFLLIDNLRRRLDSAAVSAGITSTVWEDRILGASEISRLPVRCVWLATGNNPAVSTEVARRTIRIRLDAKVDRPWLRSGFKHANLRQWATENRGRLVWAALTMIQAWIVAGRPPGRASIGMFERWAEVIGGILSVAKIPGFLGNLSDFYEQSDAEGETWRAFLAAWWERFAERETTVKELWAVATGDVPLPLGDKSEQSQKIVLGKMLTERRDRVFDLEIDGVSVRLLLKRGQTIKRAYQWHLERQTV